MSETEEVIIVDEPVTPPVVNAPPPAALATMPEPPFAKMSELFPPKARAALLATRLVEPEEFDAALERLDAAHRDAIAGLLYRLNPTNDYDNRESTGLSLNMLKIDQGAGDDPSKPGLSVKGSIYSKPRGELLIVPPSHEKALRLPTRVKVYVLALYQGRMFFAPRINGVATPPAGVELHGNAPICVSNDRLIGSRYNECRVCPYRPFASGTLDRNACKDHVDMYVCLADFSNIYRVSVAATSFKTCTDAIRQKAAGRMFWDLAFYLSTEKSNPAPGQEFYKLRAVLATDEEANGDPTPANVRPILELFARQVRTQIYLPSLGYTYAQAKAKLEAGPSPTESPDNGAGVLAAANAALTAADEMDYSKTPSGNV